jgi:N-acetylneuraminic acid mutarotase
MANAQANEWTWMGGTDANSMFGVWGTKGTPAVGNIPGSRSGASSWTDNKGNLWLFGGVGVDAVGNYSSYLNDLWEFNPSTNEWAWMGGSSTAGPYATCSSGGCGQPGFYGTLGIPAAGNIPGARGGATTWTDSNGNFWLFGGGGYDAEGDGGFLNDLWEFNPSMIEWTWMGGSDTVGSQGGQSGVYGTLGQLASGNIPGGRSDAVVWVDKTGHVWLFGGDGITVAYDSGAYNDLWEYYPSTNEWAWMGGNNSACDYGVQSGVWGAMGTPAAGNVPSCRAGASGWTDRSGNFWLFGGTGRDIDGYWGDLNSLWEFNPSTNEWAWMGGDNLIGLPTGDQPGRYGTLGTPAAGNIPASRWGAASWTDASGNFWILGGIQNGFEGDSIVSPLHDLWEFNPSANEWTWMGGNNASVSGVYGTLGTPALGNIPGSRSGASSWTDNSGNFWLYGGDGYDAALFLNYLNDVWEYVPSAPAPVPGFAVVDLNNQAFNNTQTFTVQEGTSGTTTISTVVSDGFDGTITLSAVGLPSGITASFSPSSITGFGMSQVTFAVGLDVAQGNYTLTVAGTSAGVTETTTVSLTVASAPPANFTLEASPSSLSVQAGASGTATLTVTPEYGFNSTVSFACSGLPAGAVCSFSPTSVTPSGATATTVLTISTSSQSAASRSNSRPLLSLSALAVGLCVFIKWKRRGLQYIMLVAALAGLGLTFGCGGGGAGSGNGGGSGSTPVTSTVTITATSATVMQTTSVSLTVN